MEKEGNLTRQRVKRKGKKIEKKLNFMLKRRKKKDKE